MTGAPVSRGASHLPADDLVARLRERAADANRTSDENDFLMTEAADALEQVQKARAEAPKLVKWLREYGKHPNHTTLVQGRFRVAADALEASQAEIRNYRKLAERIAVAIGDTDFEDAVGQVEAALRERDQLKQLRAEWRERALNAEQSLRPMQEYKTAYDDALNDLRAAEQKLEKIREWASASVRLHEKADSDFYGSKSHEANRAYGNGYIVACQEVSRILSVDPVPEEDSHDLVKALISQQWAEDWDSPEDAIYDKVYGDAPVEPVQTEGEE